MKDQESIKRRKKKRRENYYKCIANQKCKPARWVYDGSERFVKTKDGIIG